MIKGSKVHRTEFEDEQGDVNVLVVGEDKEGFYAILFTDPDNTDENGLRNYNTAFTLRRDEDSENLDWYYLRAITLVPSKNRDLRGIDISDEKIKPSLKVNDSLVASEIAIDKVSWQNR